MEKREHKCRDFRVFVIKLWEAGTAYSIYRLGYGLYDLGFESWWEQEFFFFSCAEFYNGAWTHPSYCSLRIGVLSWI